MSKFKHTPGPWTYRNSRSYTNIDVGPDKNIASVWHETPEYISDEEIEANARLIASAPDLLDILQRIVEMQEENYGNGSNTHINLIGLAEEAKGAIKKATE